MRLKLHQVVIIGVVVLGAREYDATTAVITDCEVLPTVGELHR